MQVNFLGDVQRLTLRPGDRIVLSCDERLSSEMVARIRYEADAHFDGHKVCVLDRGMKLGVLSPINGVDGSGPEFAEFGPNIA